MRLTFRVPLKELTADVHEALGKAVSETAHGIQAVAQREINAGGKTGRVYKRGKKRHQASAPGQAPATDTGNLSNTVAVASPLSGSGRASLEMEVVVNAEYAPVLEFGGAHIAARPFLKPATLEQKPEFEERCKRAIKGAIR